MLNFDELFNKSENVMDTSKPSTRAFHENVALAFEIELIRSGCHYSHKQGFSNDPVDFSMEEAEFIPEEFRHINSLLPQKWRMEDRLILGQPVDSFFLVSHETKSEVVLEINMNLITLELPAVLLLHFTFNPDQTYFKEAIFSQLISSMLIKTKNFYFKEGLQHGRKQFDPSLVKSARERIYSLIVGAENFFHVGCRQHLNFITSSIQARNYLKSRLKIVEFDYLCLHPSFQVTDFTPLMFEQQEARELHLAREEGVIDPGLILQEPVNALNPLDLILPIDQPLGHMLLEVIANAEEEKTPSQDSIKKN